MHDLLHRLSEVREKIARAASARGGLERPVSLIAVSKKIPLPLMLEAVQAGQMLFGESKVQEAKYKFEQLRSIAEQENLEKVEYDFIGPLQRNKVKQAVGMFRFIHSVDRLELAREISVQAAKRGLIQRVLLQVNISGEASKSGVSPSDAESLGKEILSLSNLSLEGLMSIGSYYPPDTALDIRKKEFAEMFLLQRELQQQLGHPLPELSMGMSEDFELAIEQGATMVRIGSAIFG